MPVRIRFIISILITATLIFASCGNKSDKDKQNSQQKNQPDPKDQYRMVEMFDNDKNQMVDLIQGKATFQIIYEGEGNFKARIMNTDGTELAVLADVNGNFKGKKSIDVPVTTAYILDVRCKGKWSVYRE
jgi:hypothetical protein